MVDVVAALLQKIFYPFDAEFAKVKAAVIVVHFVIETRFKYARLKVIPAVSI